MLKAMRVFLCFILILGITASAQRNRREAAPPPTPQELKLQAEMGRLRDAALGSDFAFNELRHLSNNIGPRLSGSTQAAAAVEYVAEEMRKLGADVKLETVMVPHWVRGEERAELVSYPGMPANTSLKIVVTALGMSIATPPEGITADVVVVKDLEELRKTPREKVQGKIVVFTKKFEQRMAEAGEAFSAYSIAVRERSLGATEAAKLGGLAAVIRSVGGANYRLPHTGSLTYPADAPKAPGAAAVSEDIDTIADLAQQGTVRMHLVLTPQLLPETESANVIADIKGSEHPEEIVLVGGHLDSWDLGRGAIDDGAGVASAMQVIQTIKKSGMRPKRTVRMIAFMNEENGGRGSAGYVKAHETELANHVGAIEMDNGAGHALGIVAHASTESIAKMQLAAGVLEAQGAGVIRYFPSAPGADVGKLDVKGVPTFAPYNDGRKYFDYHHTAADTLDKVDKRELQENASVLTVLSWYLANAEQRVVQTDPPATK
jgi:carboxypeptidase Q